MLDSTVRIWFERLWFQSFEVVAQWLCYFKTIEKWVCLHRDNKNAFNFDWRHYRSKHICRAKPNTQRCHIQIFSNVAIVLQFKYYKAWRHNLSTVDNCLEWNKSTGCLQCPCLLAKCPLSYVAALYDIGKANHRWMLP